MTVSTLNQVSTYPTQTQSTLIPQTSKAQVSQDRSSALNRELLSAVGKAELNRTQNTSSINPVSLSDESRQIVVAIAGYNSHQQQIEIYVNGMTGTDTYEANTINAADFLEYDTIVRPMPLYA
jgi:hypothetical protein